jgi:hypothetical protein
MRTRRPIRGLLGQDASRSATFWIETQVAPRAGRQPQRLAEATGLFVGGEATYDVTLPDREKPAEPGGLAGFLQHARTILRRCLAKRERANGYRVAGCGKSAPLGRGRRGEGHQRKHPRTGKRARLPIGRHALPLAAVARAMPKNDPSATKSR